MKEIDINIEGYNVNGICVGCLNYNRKMYYHSAIKECFRILANIDVPYGLSVQLCWECLASVRAAKRFQEKILRSYEILTEYSKKNPFLSSPEDLSQYSTTQLTITENQVYMDFTYKEDEKHDTTVKEELLDEMYHHIDVDTIKPDPEISQDSPGDDFHDNVTSEEDIQLSQLKKKKEKKLRKSKKEKRNKDELTEVKDETEQPISKKKVRKLKNLPESLVELYTMTEEEMWKIRAEDVASKEFAKLRFKCDDCIIGFNTGKLMDDHFNGKHRQKSVDCLQCEICKAYFLTKDNLSVHRSLHLTAYRCKECGLKTSLKRVMIKHVSVHKDSNCEFKCTTCNIAFSTKSKLNYHRAICLHERPQCDCCGKVFANKMTLKYHLKILPYNKDEKPKEKQYIPCKGCNKVFHSRKSYRAHVVIHDGVTFPCPTCGKMFQWKRNLARHQRNHRDRDAGAHHECRDCGKTFSSRDCYNNHMRLSKRHVAEDTYAHECNYCGKKFPTKWCMVDHIDWEHLKRIKYQCSVCFKAFKTAKIMVAHVNNIHEGKRREPEGEHLCDICGKSYKTVKRLKGHVWAMHTKRSTTKSFKCKLCPATFTWQTSIYKHMKMMHDNKRKQYPIIVQSVKKQEQYPGIELANRMQYFQQNLANNLVQNIVQTAHVQPLGVQNLQ